MENRGFHERIFHVLQSFPPSSSINYSAPITSRQVLMQNKIQGDRIRWLFKCPELHALRIFVICIFFCVSIFHHHLWCIKKAFRCSLLQQKLSLIKTNWRHTRLALQDTQSGSLKIIAPVKTSHICLLALRAAAWKGPGFKGGIHIPKSMHLNARPVKMNHSLEVSSSLQWLEEDVHE